MRWLLLLAASGCLSVSEDTDGRWTSLEEPCVPLGAATKIAAINGSVWLVPAGNTMLLTAGTDVLQIPLAGGDGDIVVRGEGLGGLGVLGDQIIHYENGGSGYGNGIDILIDEGRASATRYRRLSPRRGDDHAGLLVFPAGAVWDTFTEHSTAPEVTGYWWWNPVTDATTQLSITPRSGFAHDDRALAYFDAANSTVIYPLDEAPHVIGGNAVSEMLEPLAVRGNEVLFTHDTNDGTQRDLLLGASLDSAVTLVGSGFVTEAVLADDAVYFTDTSASNRISRVDLASLTITTFYEGPTANPFGLTSDACNVYWQEVSFESGAAGQVVGASLEGRR